MTEPRPRRLYQIWTRMRDGLSWMSGIAGMRPADARETMPLDEAGRAKLTAQQLLLAARGLVGGSLLHVALASILALVLASEKNAAAVYGWLAFLTTASLLRLGTARWYARHRAGDVRLGRLILIGSAFLVGCAWGSLAVLFFSGGPMPFEVMITFTLGGVSLGALTVSGYYLPSFFALYIPTFLPVIPAHFLVGDKLHTAMGAMLGIFFIAVIILGFRFGNTLSGMLRLQIVRDNLLERLQGTKEILESALQSRRDSFAIFDPEDRLLLWNDVFGELVMKLDGEIRAGTPFTELIRGGALRRADPITGKPDWDWFNARLRKHREPGEPFEEEIDGRWLFVQEFRTPAGYTVTVHTDVTELKEREHALRDSEAQKAGILEAAIDGVVTVDEAGRIVEFNKAAEEMFGWAADEIIGQDIGETLVPPHLREMFRAIMEEYQARGVAPLVGRRTVGRVMRKDGSQFPMEISVVKVETARGALFSGFIRDISDRIAAERRLTHARDEAQAASRAKSDFLATISHEIRTPMNGVLGAIDLLLDSTLKPDQKRLAMTAKGAGETLRMLLDDLLDFSKLEAGKLEIAPAPFTPREVVADCVDIFRAQAEMKGIEMRIEVDAEVPQVVSGDAARLRQILMNLIGNAVKFTSQGHVTARVHRLAGDAEFVVLRFAVKDTGIGIRPEFREKIFSKFSQAEPSTSRRFGGSGLGLAIVKGLTELMQGQVGYESEIGRGSHFWCDIPFVRVDAHLPAREGKRRDKDISLDGLRILVVDDSQANRLITTEMLQRAGADVVEAESGSEAVRRVADEPFDLVLMDISMPGMDGIEALACIRKAGHVDLPVVALTAHAEERSQYSFAEMGFSGYLPKPARRRVLVETVRALAGERDGKEPVHEAGATGGLDRTAIKTMEDEVGPEILARLLGTFFRESRQRRDAIAQGLEESALEIVELNAHALMSAAMSLGATVLASKAAQIERAARDGDIESSREAFAELDAALFAALRDIGAQRDAERPSA